ncbi:hypothetical protein D3C75_813410 [compost metagenome]
MQEPHHEIAVAGRCDQPVGQLQADAETRLILHPRGIQGDYRDLPQIRVFERFAQQRDIVGSPAPAARL